MNKKLLIPGFAIFLLLAASGCIENTVKIIDPVSLDNTALLLEYVEGQGDFANTEDAPGLVSASELYASMEQYNILDVQSDNQYTAGHIINASHVTLNSLYHKVDSLYAQSTTKRIILVCKNGQASAYYTSLLRLAGYKSVYCLKYGMASWNVFFADEWLKAPGVYYEINLFDNIIYDKEPLQALPSIAFTSSGTLEEKCKQRIREILEKGFVLGQNYITEPETQFKDEKYYVCYGRKELYLGGKLLPYGLNSHMPYTRWYRDFFLFELRSTNLLQTLPAKREIIIYTTNGLLSASVCAWLTVLGYNVKTILFGGNQLFAPRMSAVPEIAMDVFSTKDIMNYPYNTGNGDK